MSLLRLSLKNATVKWWRSLTLGLFIFAISFVMLVASSLISAVQDKVESVIASGVTGHLQIRSDRSFEGDMVEQYSKGWDALKPLPPAAREQVQTLLAEEYPELKQYLLTRQSAYLTGTGKREETMLIGIDSRFTHYQDAFLLSSGRYLDPAGSGEILLTEEQARAFQVQVGDTVTVMTKNRYGLNSRQELRVVGVGNFIMLSLFSYKACYVQDVTVRELVHLDADEVTDLILYSPEPAKVKANLPAVAELLEKAGLEVVLTQDEKLASTDLQVTSLDFSEDSTNRKLKISSYIEMGKTFKSAGEIMFLTLNIVVLLLMVVVSILIVNLVYMMGIERFREIGTLRAMGFSRMQVIRIFMGEILAISVIFGVAGLLVGSGLISIFGRAGIASPIPAMDYIMGPTLYLDLQLRHIMTTVLVFTGFSLAASFYPAYRACSIRPAETLRSV